MRDDDLYIPTRHQGKTKEQIEMMREAYHPAPQRATYERDIGDHRPPTGVDYDERRGIVEDPDDLDIRLVNPVFWLAIFLFAEFGIAAWFLW